MRYRTALLALTLAAFALRVAGLGKQSFWLDEVDAIGFTREPVAALVRKFAQIGENGPLYFLLFKGWVTAAGTSEFGARFLSAAASTIAPALLAQVVCRLLLRPDVALTAAALAVFSPYYVWYGQDAKMYPLFAALALGAQYCLVRGLTQTHAVRWWAGYVVLSSLALYVHLFALLLIGANTAAGGWVAARRSSGRIGFALATLLLIGPYVPLALWQGRVLLAGANVGYEPAGLRLIVTTLLWQLLWHLNRQPVYPLVGAAAATLGWGLWRVFADRERAGILSGPCTAGVLTCWLAVPVIGTIVLQATVPVFRDRYLTPLLAPMLILLARAATPPRRIPAAATLLAVAASFGYGLAHRPQNPDFRAAAAFVHRYAAPQDQIGFVAGYAQRPFDFYFARYGAPYERAVLPYSNYPGMTEQEGLLAVARSLRGGRTLWVVRFEDWLWDGRNLAGQYLTNRGAPRLRAQDFGGVSVAAYQLP